MYKYIVTWVITTMIQAPCPDANTVDEFGVKNDYYTSCSVLHLASEFETKEKTFINRDSAFAFYNRAYSNKSGFYIQESGITKVEIDSLLIKK